MSGNHALTLSNRPDYAWGKHAVRFLALALLLAFCLAAISYYFGASAPVNEASRTLDLMQKIDVVCADPASAACTSSLNAIEPCAGGDCRESK